MRLRRPTSPFAVSHDREPVVVDGSASLVKASSVGPKAASAAAAGAAMVRVPTKAIRAAPAAHSFLGDTTQPLGGRATGDGRSVQLARSPQHSRHRVVTEKTGQSW